MCDKNHTDNATDLKLFQGKAVPYVQLTAAHGSILTILAISFERYYAICQPLKAGYTCTQMRAVLIIVLVWLVACLLTSPVLLTVHYEMVESLADGQLVPACLQMVDQLWQKLYYLGIIGLFFGVPFVVLLVVYCYIAKHLVLSNRRVLASSSEESQMRARKQVVFMLIAVVVSFFVCLLPFRIFTIYLILNTPDTIRDMGMETYYSILYFSRLLLYMNSALNPILYNAISSKFRSSVIRLLRCSNVRNRLTRQITKGTTTSSTATTGGSVKNALLHHHHHQAGGSVKRDTPHLPTTHLLQNHQLGDSAKRDHPPISTPHKQLRVSVNSVSLFGEKGPKPEDV